MELGKIESISYKHEVALLVAVGGCHGVNHSSAQHSQKGIHCATNSDIYVTCTYQSVLANVIIKI